MKQLILFLAAVISLNAQVRIVNHSTRVTVASWTVGAFPQITTNEDHSFVKGDPIYVIGFASQFQMNGHLKVRTVISPKEFSVEYPNGDPLNTWGAKTTAASDQENNHSINQKRTPKEYGYVAKTVATALNQHPRGWYPADPKLRARLTDPDGTGSKSAPAMGTEHGQYLTKIADRFSSDSACKPSEPVSPSNCSLANNHLNSANVDIKYGYAIWNLALAWSMNQQNTRWKNYALAYLNNVHLATPMANGFFTASDNSRVLGGNGEDSDFASLSVYFWSQAYSLMRSEMTEQEREYFARKMIWDSEQGCENMAGEISDGPISIFAKWRRKDNLLSKIETADGVSTAFVNSSLYGMTTAQYITVRNSGVSKLDGDFFPTSIADGSPGKIVFKTPGVPNGTYTAAGMSVENRFLSGTTAIVPNTSKLTAGDRLYVRGFSSHMDAEDILNISVAGNIATANLRSNPRGSDGTPFLISGSGVPGLDGPYSMSKENITATQFTFRVTGVAAGVYSNPQLKIYISGAQNRYSSNVRISSILSETEIQLSNIGMGWKSNYTKLPEWNKNTCGISFLSRKHTFTPPFDYRRMGRLQAKSAITSEQTEIQIRNMAGSTLEGMEAPFYALLGSEVTKVTKKTIVKDNSSPTVLQVERSKFGTIPRSYIANTVIGFSRSGFDSSLTNERNSWVGPSNHNLTITRFNLCSTYLMLVEDMPHAGAEAEKWCNTFILYHSQFPREYWAGNTSSSSNIGYHYGRQINGVTYLLLTLLNTLGDESLGSQMFGPWAKSLIDWPIHIKYPYNDSHKMMFSDAGFERNFQARNILPQFFRWLYPGQESNWLNKFYRDILGYTRDMTSVSHYRTLPFVVAYETNPDLTDDFRTSAELGKIYTSPTPGSRESGKGIQTFHSRTDWNDPDATAVFALAISPSGDHNGQYNPTGAYQIVKRTELMCPGQKGCVGGAGGTGLVIQQSNSMGSIGGQPYMKKDGRIELKEPAPKGGIAVELTTTDDWMTFPRFVTVPEGKTSVDFPSWAYQNPVRLTHLVTASSKNKKTAWVNSSAASGLLQPSDVSIKSIESKVQEVTAGDYAEITVQLSSPAPAGGAIINLSTNTGVYAPTSVRVRARHASVQFAVSVMPGTSGKATITVTSANSMNTSLSIAHAAPQKGDISGITWSVPNNTYGMLSSNAIQKVIRAASGEDFTYAQFQGQSDENNGTYCARGNDYTGFCSEGTTSYYHRDLVHYRPFGSQDYVISHDVYLGSTRPQDLTGYQRLSRISHYRGNSNPDLKTGEIVVTNPPDTGHVKGRDITFIKHNTETARSGGASLLTRVLLPADESSIQSEGNVNGGFGFRAQVWLGNGKAEDGPDETMYVHAAFAGEKTVHPKSSALTTTSSNITGAIIDESPSLVATFPKSIVDLTTASFTAKPAAAGIVLMTGFAKGSYQITRNSSNHAVVCVANEGVLKFEIPQGGGEFSISQTLKNPCTEPIWWITRSLPSGGLNAPYSVNITATAGEGSISYGLTGGKLPSGVSLAPSGKLEGTPKEAGSYTFQIKANDRTNSISRSFVLEITKAASALPVKKSNSTEESSVEP